MQESSDSGPLLTEHDYIGLSEVSSSASPFLPPPPPPSSPGPDPNGAPPSHDLRLRLDLGLGLGLGLGPASSAPLKDDSAPPKRCCDAAGEAPLKSHCGSHDSCSKYAAFPEFLPLPPPPSSSSSSPPSSSSLLHKNGAKRGYAEANNICGVLKKNEARFHHHAPHPHHPDSSPASYLPAVEAAAAASSSSSTPEQHAKPLICPSFLQTWPLPPSTSSSSMKKNGTLNSNAANAVPVNPWHADKPVSANAFSASEKASDIASADDAPPCKDRVVGWPPVRSYRRQTLSKPAESFVKVNMDGITVGRKVDLNAYNSYESLLLALEEMFQPSSNAQGASQALSGREKHFLLSGGSDFVLTYEDKEGDWMLVGDVPWSMFISTVKRLRIARGSEANTPASRGPEKSRL